MNKKVVQPETLFQTEHLNLYTFLNRLL